jgi:hypothetical protein
MAKIFLYQALQTIAVLACQSYFYFSVVNIFLYQGLQTIALSIWQNMFASVWPKFSCVNVAEQI